MQNINTIVFFRNGNWNAIDSDGQQSIYRVLCDDERYIYVVHVGTVKNGSFRMLSPGKRAKDRATWVKAHAEQKFKDGRLLHIEERCIPSEMLNDLCSKWIDEAFEKRRNVIKYIMEKWHWDDLIRGKAFYAAAIKDAAQKFNVSVVSIRQWLETHIFYGGHPNALIEHHWAKGGPGVPRRGLRNKEGRYVECLGRPTDAEVLDPKTPHKRRRLTPRLFFQYSEFLKSRAIESDDNFPKVYEDFKAGRRSYNRSEDGTTKSFQVSPRGLPSDEYLKRVGRAIFKDFRFSRDSEKKYEIGKRRSLSGGSAQDIVCEQLSVLDMDGTPADNQVLFGEHVVRFGKHGKPTVILAVDRASAAIVGWHVGFRPEDSNSYLGCLLSAYTSKETELNRWDVPHLDGMVYGSTSQIFIDRGPAISKKVQRAAVEFLRTHSIMAAPRDAAGKGHAEQVMRYFQAALSNEVGSTHTTGDADKDFKRRRKSKHEAISLADFMRALLIAISRRNMEMDARHLLTPEMIKNDIAPRPKAIYEYNKGRLRGDANWVWSEEEILRKLSVRHEKKVTGAGIVTITGRNFSSGDLVLHTAWYKNTHHKPPVVVVYENPIAPLVLLWENPDGILVRLDATKQTKKIFEDGFSWSIEFQNKMRNSSYLASVEEARDNQAEIYKAKAGRVSKVRQKKMDEVESKSVNVIDDVVVSRTDAQRQLECDNLYSALPALAHVPTIPDEAPPSAPAFYSNAIDDDQKLEVDF